MRLWKAEEMASRVGWQVTIREVNKLYGGHKVSYVYPVRDNDRIALLPFTRFCLMSKGDFAASLARLPQEVKAS